MRLWFGTGDSVAGTFGYLWYEDGGRPVIIGSGWTEDAAELLDLVHPGLLEAAAGAPGTRSDPVIDEAVSAYSDGELTAVDAVTVRQRSGPFIESAWQALRDTPAGTPQTYTELAARAGRPAAVRAAAAACAANATALFVPCHRIVRRDGGLGGFRYGLAAKRRLLAHEASDGR